MCGRQGSFPHVLKYSQDFESVVTNQFVLPENQELQPEIQDLVYRKTIYESLEFMPGETVICPFWQC